MIGPEGDLTMQEKDLLKERDVQFLRLTPTVLRAQQAVAVSMGILGYSDRSSPFTLPCPPKSF